MHTKSRHILVIDVSLPKELSLKSGNSRKNIVHCGKLVKYNMLEICQVLLLGEKKNYMDSRKENLLNLDSANSDILVLVQPYTLPEETLSIAQDT